MFRPLTSLSFILVASLSIESALAAGGPPMITDDPGTPGDGHWEINIATLSSQTAGVSTYQLPLIDANYGVGDRIQLKFEIPWLIQEESNGDNRSTTGDGLIGVKWRFYDAGETAWQISTYPQVAFSLPLSNSSTNDGIEDSGSSYLLPLEFEHGFDGFDINFEFGRWIRPAPQTDSWIAGCVLTREIKKGFELLAELHEEAAVHQPMDELIINFGARWRLSEQYTLLASSGRDLHNTLGNINMLLTYLSLQIRY